jgi:alkylation response protein AidB-like acyl-CoA dehydrogenase
VTGLALTPEQEELRATVRRFLDDKSPSSEVRRLMESPEGHDETVWKQMGQELALQGIHIPEQYGGQGFSFVELGVVLGEMGGSLLCAPFFSTVCLAANAILNAGTDEQKADLLPRIASGDAIATLALTEPSGKWNAEGIAAEAVPSDGGYRISGTKSFVTDGAIADLIVVAARSPGSTGEEGVGLFVVDGDADGLTRNQLVVMDATRKQAELVLNDVTARPLGEPGAAWPALERTLDHAAVCLSAEMVGGAQRCLDMAVEYAKTRVQFGKPIGMFQAIKHKCADMLVEVESGRAAVAYALMAAAEEDEELPVVASVAKAFCSDAYFQVASENIQVHGGLGFTWEHDAHLYFRRAKSSELLLGDATYHRDQVARRLGI